MGSCHQGRSKIGRTHWTHLVLQLQKSHVRQGQPLLKPLPVSVPQQKSLPKVDVSVQTVQNFLCQSLTPTDSDWMRSCFTEEHNGKKGHTGEDQRSLKPNTLAVKCLQGDTKYKSQVHVVISLITLPGSKTSQLRPLVHQRRLCPLPGILSHVAVDAAQAFIIPIILWQKAPQFS